MCNTRSSRGAVLIILSALLVLGAISAWAQGGGQTSSAVAVSFAYSGDENGARLELSQGAFTYGVGYFDDDDDHGNVYCAELGLSADELIGGYEGLPFVIGGGYYHLDPADAELDTEDDFTVWAGLGDFDHKRNGLFYQYRYIFGGPLGGSQGVLGWAF